MGIFLIFLCLGLLPFIVAGLIYVVKVIIYAIRKPAGKKVVEEARANYNKCVKEIEEKTVKAEKDLRRYAHKNAEKISAEKVRATIYQMTRKQEFIVPEVAIKYGVNYNWFCRGIESEDEYIRRRLNALGVSKPSFYIYDDIDELRFILSCLALIVGIVGVISTGAIASVEHSSLITNRERIKIDTTMNNLKVNYKILDSQEARKREDWAKAVVEHNNNVYTFDTKVKDTQYRLSNGWVNWFHNPVWNTVSVAEVESLYIK